MAETPKLFFAQFRQNVWTKRSWLICMSLQSFRSKFGLCSLLRWKKRNLLTSSCLVTKWQNVYTLCYDTWRKKHTQSYSAVKIGAKKLTICLTSYPFKKEGENFKIDKTSKVWTPCLDHFYVQVSPPDVQNTNFPPKVLFKT